MLIYKRLNIVYETFKVYQTCIMFIYFILQISLEISPRMNDSWQLVVLYMYIKKKVLQWSLVNIKTAYTSACLYCLLPSVRQNLK